MSFNSPGAKLLQAVMAKNAARHLGEPEYAPIVEQPLKGIQMSNRAKNAIAVQNGASNPIVLTRLLDEAVRECLAENSSVQDDAAVFLISHQLVYVVTGHDFAMGRMNQRWQDSMALLRGANDSA